MITKVEVIEDKTKENDDSIVFCPCCLNEFDAKDQEGFMHTSQDNINWYFIEAFWIKEESNHLTCPHCKSKLRIDKCKSLNVDPAIVCIFITALAFLYFIISMIPIGMCPLPEGSPFDPYALHPIINGSLTGLIAPIGGCLSS